MKKLGPLFAFLLAATPTVALAQDPSSFDRINLKLQENGQTVDVTVTKTGRAFFVFPDHVLKKTLTPDELKTLEGSVKGVFSRGSPATDLGGPADKPKFELTMNAADGTRWVAKGPVDVLRGGPLPPVYHVVRDLQGFEKSAVDAAAAPAPAGDPKALPGAEPRLALPAPAAAASAPRDIVFTENGRKVEVIPATGELVVTTSDGTQIRTHDPATVDAVVKAATDARLTEYANRFKINASDAANPFQLYVQGEDGKTLRIDGPLAVASWNSAQLRGSVGPIVEALAAVSTKADADHLAAKAATDAAAKDAATKDAKSGKGGLLGLFGIDRFVATFQAEAAKIQGWGRDAAKYLKSVNLADVVAKTKGFLGGIGDFVKNAWDRVFNKGDAAKATAKTDETVTDVKTDPRGFSRTPGMAEALNGRVQAEVDSADGKGSDKAP